MKGILWQDLRRMRWWLAAGFGIMLLMYFLMYRTGYRAVWYGIVMQMISMLILRNSVEQDRNCGWDRYTAVLPHGRGRYLTEKFCFLVWIWAVMAVGALAGRLLWVERHYWSVLERASSLDMEPLYPTEHLRYYIFRFAGGFGGLGSYDFYLFPGLKIALTWLLLLTAVQAPVLLLSSGTVSAVWDVVTWISGFFTVFWIQSGHVRSKIRTEQSGDYAQLEYTPWEEMPWNTILAAACVLFLLSAVLTVLAGRRAHGPLTIRSLSPRALRRQSGKTNLLRVLSLVWCSLLLAGGLSYLNTIAPLSFTYIYSRTTHDGGTDYLTSNQTPEELAADNDFGFLEREYRLAGLYPKRIHNDPDIGEYLLSTQIFGGIDGTFLIWDGEWFLWEMETGEKTLVAIPLEEPRGTDAQMLSPDIVALWDSDLRATGFFSIRENRMITDFVYTSYEDDLIDGQIAARRKGTTIQWVLIDPATGEVTGSLPGRP